MARIACYLEPAKPRSSAWMQAFAEGCDGTLVENGQRDRFAADHAVMGHWPVAERIIAELSSEQVEFWHLDSAYIQATPIRMLRIERNRFWPDLADGRSMDRARRMGVQLKPWRHGGRHVLLALHGMKFGRPWGIDIAAWHATIEARIRAVTDRPIIVRCKPISPAAKAAAPSIESQLVDAWCLVTHSSTIAVQAALAGVPVFCEPTCAAAPVGCVDFARIEAPVRPEREAWIAALAWRQWSADEMRSGRAWAHVRNHQ